MAPLSPTTVFDFPEVSRKATFLRSETNISQNNSNFENPKNGYFAEEFSQFNDPKMCDSLENKFDFFGNRSFFDRDFGSERSDFYAESPVECIDEWESRNSFDFEENFELNGENFEKNMGINGGINGVNGENRFSGDSLSWREFPNSSASTSGSEISGSKKKNPVGQPPKNNRNGLRRTSSLPTNIICQDAEKACDVLEMDAARTRIKEAASHVWEAEQLLTALRLQEENSQIFGEDSRNSGNSANLGGSRSGLNAKKSKNSGRSIFSRPKNFEFEDILDVIFNESDSSENEEDDRIFEKKSNYGIFSKRGSKKENGVVGKSTLIRSMWVWVSGFGAEKTKKREGKTKEKTKKSCSVSNC